MRKSLNLLAAASLLAALGACNRQQPDKVTPDDERALDNAAAMTYDNTIVDTSADDQSVNAEDVVEENEAEAAPANGTGNRTANQQ
jgi:predicted small lipoprotein YifL